MNRCSTITTTSMECLTLRVTVCIWWWCVWYWPFGLAIYCFCADAIPCESAAGRLRWRRRTRPLLHGLPVLSGQGALRCPRLWSLPHSVHPGPGLQTRSSTSPGSSFPSSLSLKSVTDVILFYFYADLTREEAMNILRKCVEEVSLSLRNQREKWGQTSMIIGAQNTSTGRIISVFVGFLLSHWTMTSSSSSSSSCSWTNASSWTCTPLTSVWLTRTASMTWRSSPWAPSDGAATTTLTSVCFSCPFFVPLIPHPSIKSDTDFQTLPSPVVLLLLQSLIRLDELWSLVLTEGACLQHAGVCASTFKPIRKVLRKYFSKEKKTVLIFF